MFVNDFNKSVSEIVRDDYRTADVFRRHGINYCCSGQVSLEEACTVRGLDSADLTRELQQATRLITLSNKTRFDEWKTDFLIDYIVNVHHAYVSESLPRVQLSLASFAASHEKKFPYLSELVEVVSRLSLLLTTHNRHEEEIIFPYIKQIDNAYRRKESYGNLFVRTLRKPFSAIELEHGRIEELLLDLRRLTNHYRFPDNACTNHRVVWHQLEELDNDLAQHEHLENNILFPKVAEMERELLQL
jgi:regulator of cell morphogenesis and NO signaling